MKKKWQEYAGHDVFKAIVLCIKEEGITPQHAFQEVTNYRRHLDMPRRKPALTSKVIEGLVRLVLLGEEVVAANEKVGIPEDKTWAAMDWIWKTKIWKENQKKKEEKGR